MKSALADGRLGGQERQRISRMTLEMTADDYKPLLEQRGTISLRQMAVQNSKDVVYLSTYS